MKAAAGRLRRGVLGFLGLLGLVGLLALAAPGDGDAPRAPAGPWPAPSPALWEIAAPDGPGGWLFGTVHALPEGLAWRTPALAQALAASGVLMVEIVNPASGQRDEVFRALALGRAHPPLLARVPAARRPALARLLAQTGYKSEDFTQTETWAAALILANAARKANPALGVDRALLDEAPAVWELEGLRSQLQIFAQMPAPEQVDLLLAVVHEAQSEEEAIVLTLWLAGDLEALLARARAPGGLLAAPSAHEKLLAARNRRFAPQIIASLVRGDRPFVAVGALHLAGEEGLVALLEKEGLEVRRIQ